jgi:hypothetical protein
MRTKYLLVLSFWLIAFAAKAQFSLSFCESITANGEAVRASNSFTVGNNGSLLKLLVKGSEGFNSAKLEVKIFYINDNGDEEELSVFNQDVESGWNYVWKEIGFFNPGVYRVKVYNKEGTYLTSANLSLKKT